MTFRWYGAKDSVTLDKIRQIPAVKGIVASLYHVPPGEVWESGEILALKKTINDAGLSFEVIESVPVHEDIKLGAPTRDKYIENYIETVRRLGKAGIKVICYNFMPVFDWMRSDLNKQNSDGSSVLAYDNKTVNDLNPLTLADDLKLPAWDKSFTKERLVNLLTTYQEYTEERFFDNVRYFLERVIPAAEEVGINMAIHPDDPPWSIYGLPRVIGNETNMKTFLDIVKSKNNGVTFCTGSFGSSPKNNLTEMIKVCSGRIHFAHLRNVLITGDKCFEEAGHLSEMGSIDMYAVAKALRDNGFDGYVRPDHGRAIWGEKGMNGYGLYDRALGAMYLAGLFEAIDKGDKKC
jgi:mannonate dehydratase